MVRRRSLFNYERWYSMSEEEQLEWLLDQHDKYEKNQEAKRRRDEEEALPYELYIYVDHLMEVPMWYPDEYTGELKIYDTKNERMQSQAYYNWYNLKEEALAKFDEKMELKVKPILKDKYYDCYPAYSVTIKLTKGTNIIKEEHYEIN